MKRFCLDLFPQMMSSVQVFVYKEVGCDPKISAALVNDIQAPHQVHLDNASGSCHEQRHSSPFLQRLILSAFLTAYREPDRKGGQALQFHSISAGSARQPLQLLKVSHLPAQDHQRSTAFPHPLRCMSIQGDPGLRPGPPLYLIQYSGI